MSLIYEYNKSFFFREKETKEYEHPQVYTVANSATDAADAAASLIESKHRVSIKMRIPCVYVCLSWMCVTVCGRMMR